MTLSKRERVLIKSLWSKAAPHSRNLGAEVFERLFLNYPQTKTYFKHFDMSHGSADLHSLGEKMFNALGNAVNHQDDLDSSLSPLGDLLGKKWKMHPKNFTMMSKTIKGVMAEHFPHDMTAETQTAWDKFISEVSTVLTTKYK